MEAWVGGRSRLADWVQRKMLPSYLSSLPRLADWDAFLAQRYETGIPSGIEDYLNCGRFQLRCLDRWDRVRYFFERESAPVRHSHVCELGGVLNDPPPRRPVPCPQHALLESRAKAELARSHFNQGALLTASMLDWTGLCCTVPQWLFRVAGGDLSRAGGWCWPGAVVGLEGPRPRLLLSLFGSWGSLLAGFLMPARCRWSHARV